MINLPKSIKSFKYAIKGIRYCYINENNFRIHTLATIVVIVVGAYMQVTITEWCILILCMGMVICTEIVNTAIEKLTDLVSPGYNIKAGVVKDISSSAVLIASLVSVICALIIFIKKII